MTDMGEQKVFPNGEVNAVPAEAPNSEATAPLNEVDAATVETQEVNGTWRTAAGRKGALRVHELIEAGKRYEQEHGLKSGRQRLRQLIELGKLYEQEHGVQPPAPARKRRRLARAERSEVVATLLNCLVRMAKPSFRADLERLAENIKVDKSQAA
jgi:hypothetical protein